MSIFHLQIRDVMTIKKAKGKQIIPDFLEGKVNWIKYLIQLNSSILSLNPYIIILNPPIKFSRNN